MINNLIDIDTALHAASLAKLSFAQLLPALILFDFAAAFPSLAWIWIWTIFIHSGFPCWYIAAIKVFYHKLIHYYRLKGKVKMIFEVFSGIKQGCPMSSIIFAVATHPFINALLSSLRSSAACSLPSVPSYLPFRLRIYADDTALLCWHIVRQLPDIPRIFELFASCSGLQLKPPKCIIVCTDPLDIPKVKALLVAMNVGWENFKVQLHGKYLGGYVGPNKAQFTWRAASTKYLARGMQLYRSPIGLTKTILAYNRDVFSVLQFVCQFAWAPQDLLNSEARLLNLFTKGPWNAITGYILQQIGFVFNQLAPNTLRATNWAALVRTALTPGSCWFCNAKELCSSIDKVPFVRWDSWKSLWPMQNPWHLQCTGLSRVASFMKWSLAYKIKSPLQLACGVT